MYVTIGQTYRNIQGKYPHRKGEFVFVTGGISGTNGAQLVHECSKKRISEFVIITLSGQARTF